MRVRANNCKYPSVENGIWYDVASFEILAGAWFGRIGGLLIIIKGTQCASLPKGECWEVEHESTMEVL